MYFGEWYADPICPPQWGLSFISWACGQRASARGVPVTAFTLALIAFGFTGLIACLALLYVLDKRMTAYERERERRAAFWRAQAKAGRTY